MVRILLLGIGMSWLKRRDGWRYLVAVCLGLTVASQASALGLGEIELDSALNERLNAEIELIDASSLQPMEIIVSLASNEDFERVGVERFFFLTNLRFEVSYGAGGVASVLVTSLRPISEPYLNFIVEVMWPNGRLLKEFTLLLDPPTFTQAAAPRVSAPVVPAAVEQTAGRIERAQPTTPASRPQSQVRVSPPSQPPSTAPADELSGSGEYRMTDRDDTLWTIAQRTRASEQITVQQNMLAIQRLNPRAFIRNNINLLKAGYVLRLPTQSEALSMTSREATQEVAVQNEAWRSRSRGAPAAQPAQQIARNDRPELRGQVDATPTRPASESQTESAGQLRIVAGQQGNATSGGADETATSEQVNAALEEQDRLSREVEELTYRLDREQEIATSQLAVRDRQLQVKDQQIAELQAQMQQVQEQMAALAAQNQNQNAPTTASLQWWQSPYVLGGGLGVLVLLLVVLMIRARRSQEAETEFYAEPVAEPVVSPKPAAEEIANEAEAQEQVDDETVEDFEASYDDRDEDRESDDEQAPLDEEDDSDIQGLQTSDVIGEADIYIAYGRYPQAIALLLGVIDEQPERNDVRLKLLELYVETNDKEAFDSHMSGLLGHCDDEDALLTAREFEGRLGENELAVDAPLEGVSGEGEPVKPEAGDDEIAYLEDGVDGEGFADAKATDGDEFHLDLDNDETQSEDVLGEESLELLSDNDAGGDDFELEIDDFDGADADSEDGSEDVAEDASSIEEVSLDSAVEVEDGTLELEDQVQDDLGGDLGIDFDPATEAPVSDAEEDGATAPDEATAEVDSELEDLDSLNLDDIEFDSEAAKVAVNAEDEEFASEVTTAEEDEFEFEDESDSADTKLDLAKAYIDMGDTDGARDILTEVMSEGSTDQQQQAEKLLDSL